MDSDKKNIDLLMTMAVVLLDLAMFYWVVCSTNILWPQG